MARSSYVLAAALVVSLLLAGCAPAADGAGVGGAAGAGGASSGAGAGGLAAGAGSGGLGSAGLGGVAGSGGGGAGVSSGGVAGGGSSSGGSGAGPALVEASFATVRQVVVQAHCADASCHNGEVKPRLQDDATLHATLTSHISVACGNIPVVTPGNPEQSALVKLLKGPCGELPRMPNGCVSEPIEEYTCLPPAYIDAIERWVRDGALP